MKLRLGITIFAQHLVNPKMGIARDKACEESSLSSMLVCAKHALNHLSVKLAVPSYIHRQNVHQ